MCGCKHCFRELFKRKKKKQTPMCAKQKWNHILRHEEISFSRKKVCRWRQILGRSPYWFCLWSWVSLSLSLTLFQLLFAHYSFILNPSTFLYAYVNGTFFFVVFKFKCFCCFFYRHFLYDFLCLIGYHEIIAYFIILFTDIHVCNMYTDSLHYASNAFHPKVMN